MITNNWLGDLTLDNLQEVAEKINEMLTGKKYTFVSVNMMGNKSRPGYLTGRPDVRTSQTLKDKQAMSFWFDKEQDPPQYGGFNFNDSYGIWGCSVSANPGEEPYSNPYIVFEWTKVAITHRAPAGHLLYWTIALEKD